MEKLVATETLLSTLFFVRHGQKTDDGVHITEENLAGIRANGIPSLKEYESRINVIHLGTDLVRTQETVLAYAEYLSKTYGTEPKFLEKTEKLGSELMWSEKMFVRDHPKYEAYFGSKDSFVKTWQARETPEVFQKWGSYFVTTLQAEIFDKLNDGDFAITINHTPTIEAINCSISGEEDCPNMKVLEGIMITKDSDNKLSVKRL